MFLGLNSTYTVDNYLEAVLELLDSNSPFTSLDAKCPSPRLEACDSCTCLKVVSTLYLITTDFCRDLILSIIDNNDIPQPLLSPCLTTDDTADNECHRFIG